jgi:hypothetical protein
MRIADARQAARRWVVENAGGIPGFCGAYTAGSTNWLPGDAELPATTDLDIMVVADQSNAAIRDKFRYRGALLEVSYLSSKPFESPESILGDYHLAPSFVTTNLVVDPVGRLGPLLEAVRRGYADGQWVRKRCAQARSKVLENLGSIDERAPLYDQVIAWLFAAGISCHVLLAAGLRNPTVRWRYAAVRELLADHGRLDFHESLLEMLGVARIGRQRAEEHLAAMTGIFDRAASAVATPFPFAADVRDNARPLAIGGSIEMIERGFHREAMFWIAVTHSRCQKVMLSSAPGQMTEAFRDGYRELLDDLGVSDPAQLLRRSAELELFLPRVWEVAQAILAANREAAAG